MSDFYRSGTRPPPALRTSGPSSYKLRKDPEVKLLRVSKRKPRRSRVLHGAGTWKIAYADFATAMMAFFMLLWMMVALKPEQKVGLATYFDPQTLTFAKTSGAGGILGGRSIAEEGSSVASYAPKSSADKLNQTRDEEAKPGSVLKDHTEAPAPAAQPPSKSEADKRIMQWLEKRWTQLQAPSLTEEDKRKISEQVEAAEFRKAADDLHQAIQNSADGAQLEKNLLIEQTPEGLRIQLVDQERTPMFALGSTELNDTAKKLITLVVQAIKNLPHKIAITGHTDGNPYRAASYSNWDLSVGRANASRRLLIDNGLDGNRIASVVGKADTEHLIMDDPLAPANRRISFLLLRLRPVTSQPSDPAPAPSAVP